MPVKVRKVEAGSLSMNSLLDILTVLLLFLLKSFAAEGQLLNISDLVKIPTSNSDLSPKRNLNVIVNNKLIVVEDETVETDVPGVLKTEELVIPSLNDKLAHESERMQYIAERDGVPYTGGITILADKNIPYKLLKRVMFTAAQNDFPDIMLAVTQK